MDLRCYLQVDLQCHLRMNPDSWHFLTLCSPLCTTVRCNASGHLLEPSHPGRQHSAWRPLGFGTFQLYDASLHGVPFCTVNFSKLHKLVRQCNSKALFTLLGDDNLYHLNFIFLIAGKSTESFVLSTTYRRGFVMNLFKSFSWSAKL